MFAARSSWHSYPYPLRGRKAEGQSTQTPEAADLSAFFLAFFRVPSEFQRKAAGTPSASFVTNQPYLTNQTQQTVPNQPDRTTPTMRRSAIGRCIMAPARRDVLIVGSREQAPTPTTEIGRRRGSGFAERMTTSRSSTSQHINRPAENPLPERLFLLRRQRPPEGIPEASEPAEGRALPVMFYLSSSPIKK